MSAMIKQTWISLIVVIRLVGVLKLDVDEELFELNVFVDQVFVFPCEV